MRGDPTPPSLAGGNPPVTILRMPIMIDIIRYPTGSDRLQFAHIKSPAMKPPER